MDTTIPVHLQHPSAPTVSAGSTLVALPIPFPNWCTSEISSTPFCVCSDRNGISIQDPVLRWSTMLSVDSDTRCYAVDRVQVPSALHHDPIRQNGPNAPIDGVCVPLSSPVCVRQIRIGMKFGRICHAHHRRTKSVIALKNGFFYILWMSHIEQHLKNKWKCKTAKTTRHDQFQGFIPLSHCEMWYTFAWKVNGRNVTP